MWKEIRAGEGKALVLETEQGICLHIKYNSYKSLLWLSCGELTLGGSGGIEGPGSGGPQQWSRWETVVWSRTRMLGMRERIGVKTGFEGKDGWQTL